MRSQNWQKARKQHAATTNKDCLTPPNMSSAELGNFFPLDSKAQDRFGLHFVLGSGSQIFMLI